MIRDRDELQAPMYRQQHGHRPQRLERQRDDRRERELARRRFRQPAWDLKVEAVRSTDRDGEVRVARCANQLELCTGQWME